MPHCMGWARRKSVKQAPYFARDGLPRGTYTTGTFSPSSAKLSKHTEQHSPLSIAAIIVLLIFDIFTAPDAWCDAVRLIMRWAPRAYPPREPVASCSRGGRSRTRAQCMRVMRCALPAICACMAAAMMMRMLRMKCRRVAVCVASLWVPCTARVHLQQQQHAAYAFLAAAPPGCAD